MSRRASPRPLQRCNGRRNAKALKSPELKLSACCRGRRWTERLCTFRSSRIFATLWSWKTFWNHWRTHAKPASLEWQAESRAASGRRNQTITRQAALVWLLWSPRSRSGSPQRLAAAASFQLANGSRDKLVATPGASNAFSPIQSWRLDMLRMGKNPNEEKSQTQTEDYSTRSYSPYQSGETNTRPPIQTAGAAPKALTASETIAREIKERNPNGFVGSGTNCTGETSF